MRTFDQIYNMQFGGACKIREKITVNDAAAVVSLTAGNITHATHGSAYRAEISVESKNVRVTKEGTAPTNPADGTDVGTTYAAGASFSVLTPDLSNFKAIINTATETAYLNVDYFYAE